METESKLNGTKMPNEVRKAELEEYFRNHSNDGELFVGSLNEAELCAAYGYELAMSPTETVMPEGEDDESWLIDEVSPTENILTDIEQFDLLETDLFGSQDPNCSGESSNLNCMIKPQMDQHNCCQCEDENLNLGPIGKEESRAARSLSVDPTHFTVGSSQASQEAPTEHSPCKTTEFVQALTRRMTLSQKMKFYAWFNNGLSIAEAAKKSKTPDLIPPPIRHPSCKFSKRRLRRLSKLLPNVFLQRQFVYETYFAGVDPKQIMRSLLIELNSEDLIPIFEYQFTTEELAIEDKKRRRAASKTFTAIVEISSGEKANLEPLDTTIRCSREEEANSEPLVPIQSLDATVNNSFPELHREQSSGINVHVHDEVHDDDGDGILRAEVATELHKMSLTRRTKFYKWCNQGISPSEALEKAKVPGLIPNSVPHPSNKYSWEETKIMSALLPESLKKIFIAEVFYGGKEPEEVIKTLMPDNVHPNNSSNTNVDLVYCSRDEAAGDSQKSPELHSTQAENGPSAITNTGPAGLPKMSLNKRKKYYQWCNEGVRPAEALVNAKLQGLIPKDIPHPNNKYTRNEVRKMSDMLPIKLKMIFRTEVFYGGKEPEEVMKTLTDDFEIHRSFNENLKLVLGSREKSQPSAESKNGPTLSPIERTCQSECIDKYHSNPPQPKTNPKTTKKDEYELCAEPVRNMRVNYLVARGLTQEEASSKLENPPKKVIKELDNEQAHLKEQQILRVLSQDSQPACGDSLERLPESENVPLGSPFHPSNILDDKQLVNYYLWISSGCSKDDAMKNAMTTGLPTHHLYRQHHLKSQLDFHDIQRKSKLLPTRALAKRFVIETYYGGNDPDETMKFLDSSGSGNRSCELSPAHQVLVSNPWYSSSLIKGAVPNLIPAMAPAFNACIYPGLPSQHQNQGLAPKDVQVVNSPGISTAAISGCGRPSAPIEPENHAQQNDMRTDDSETAPHKSEYQSCEDVSQLRLEPGPEHLTRSARTSMSEPREVDGSLPKLTEGEVKCFIVPANYPKEWLSEPQMDAIESSILEAILEMEEDDVKPSFKDSFRSDGRYGVLCNGQFSVNWLRMYLRQYVPYESASLRLMISEQSAVRASAVFPLCKGDDDKKILKFIEKQNHGLNVSRWTVIRRWDSDENTIMNLEIDEESAEVLQNGNRVSFKLGGAEITVAKSGSTSSQNGCYMMDASSSAELSTCPPLPSSPIPSTPLPPPPLEEPKVIDTSLKSLLFGSASKSSHQDHAQDDSPVRYSRSPVRHVRKRASLPNGVHRKRRRRHRSSSEDRSRSRSSSLDSIGHSIHELSKKICVRRRSRNEYSSSRGRRRSYSRSPSRDRIRKRKRQKKHQRRHSSRSSIYRGRTLDGKDQGSSERLRHPARSLSSISSQSNFSIDGHSVESVNGKCSDKSWHPKTMTSIVISSESDFSTDGCPPVDSRLERASSCENTEYVEYLR